MDHKRRIEPISIEFKDGLTPYSPLFDDVYYTHGTGIEESTYVYLEGSGFSDALKKKPEQNHFRIGEIGFGVGLNFLLTARHFLQQSLPHQRMTYVTVEKHPVLLEDLKKLYADSSDFPELSKALLSQYPVLVPGIHSLSFAQGKIRLILMLGEAREMFSNLSLPSDQKIEFWYWDGFAPNRNPDAFQDSLFKDLIGISAPGARATSFTSAGWVRRGLQAQGYRIHKRPGFGFKRECIQVEFPEDHSSKKIKKPWFSAEKLKRAKPGEIIAVIGAGLSGTAIARALAERGCQILLMDQEKIAAHASGNTYGMYNTQLSKKPNPISRFSQLALVHFLREVDRLGVINRKGILRLDAIRDPDDFRTAMQTSEFPDSFFEFRADGMYFPECGVLNPSRLCEVRANHPKISWTKATVNHVLKKNERFEIHCDDGRTLIADHVVYATGSAFVQDQHLKHPILSMLPLRPIRGQVIHVKPTSESEKLDHCLVDSGYISPAVPEISGSLTHCVGATYQAKSIDPDQVALDTETLLKEAQIRHPVFASLRSDDVVSYRVGYRLSTPDKLPLIGPLCDLEKLRTPYTSVLRSGKEESEIPLDAEPGEWVFTAMGSRGITFSSYGAEILAALMVGDPLPIEADLWSHVHSARFMVRQLRGVCKPGAPTVG